jgi:hypothetical protein
VRETDFSAVHLSGNLPGCCARERQIESQQRLTPTEKSGSGAAHAAVPKTSSRDEIGRATRRTKTRPGEGKNLREDQSRDQEKTEAAHEETRAGRYSTRTKSCSDQEIETEKNHQRRDQEKTEAAHEETRAVRTSHKQNLAATKRYKQRKISETTDNT